MHIAQGYDSENRYANQDYIAYIASIKKQVAKQRNELRNPCFLADKESCIASNSAQLLANSYCIDSTLSELCHIKQRYKGLISLQNKYQDQHNQEDIASYVISK